MAFHDITRPVRPSGIAGGHFSGNVGFSLMYDDRGIMGGYCRATLRGSFSIAMILGCSLPAFSQPVRLTTDWASCVEELELPTDAVMPRFYPGVRTVNASVIFSSGGSPTVVVDAGKRSVSDAVAVKSVSDAVTIALEASRYRGKRCAGKSLALVFTFIVEGTPAREAYPPRTVLKPPNQFVLYLHPQLPIGEPAPARPK